MKTIKDKHYTFKHTQKRLKERYDIKISLMDYNYLCEKVESHKDVILIMIEKQKNDVQYIYDLNFKYRGTIRVVWSEERHLITTVLKR